jgi:asparagine synthase (glutamine-hydrolysing)
MCGILCNIGEEEITPLYPGLEIIHHRGPDDFGAISFFVNKLNVGLGHRRLSIIDLSPRGKQPMSYANEKLWITFNGEIYNYLEIKEEIAKDGFVFQSDTDTEVLLAAYRKWGKDCLSKFNGMFSFCLYDRQKNRMFIARDRFGIKPLYYYNDSKNFRAMSEIKQVLSVPGYQHKANMHMLFHFLNSGDFSFATETMWDQVFELQPGHYIELDLDKWRPGDEVKQECWYAPDFTQNCKIDFEEASEEFRRLLNESVKLRLRSDVPLGFLLSGGLDSSTLVCMAHKLLSDKDGLKTYSSCYEDRSIDEREYIYEVLEHVGAQAGIHFPQPSDITENLDKVIWHNDIPVIHGSAIPHWLIYRSIRRENDSRIVILEGQGADEILCGYGDFHWAFLNEKLRLGGLPAFLKQLKEFQKNQHEPWKIILRKFKRIRFPATVKYPVNSSLDKSFFFGKDNPPSIAIKREEPTVAALHRNRMKILRYILHNVDRNSMSQSRETRVPFLDHNLVNFCLSLPSEFKVAGGVTKRVMRAGVKDILPEKIMNRFDKQGYSSPVGRWSSNELLTFFDDGLRRLHDFPFVNKQQVVANFEKFKQGQGVFDPVWWRLISVSRWMDIFNITL